MKFGEWIEWDGSAHLPPGVDSSDPVLVEFLSGHKSRRARPASDWSWRYWTARAGNFDIGRYRLPSGHPAYS